MNKKNVVLITVDCLRPDHLNCYGYKRPTSPFISSLAERGWKFVEAYAVSSYTSASVVSIATSTYPFDYGEYFECSTPARLSRRRVLVSEVLKAHGYSTAFFHDNPYLSPIYGYGRGFDLVVDFGAVGATQKAKKVVFSVLKDERVQRKIWKTKSLLFLFKWYFKDTPVNTRAETMLGEAFRWALKARKPYFVWIHLMDAHIPYTPKEEALKRFGINKKLALRIIYKHYYKRKLLTREELEIFKLIYDSLIYQIDLALSRYLLKIVGDGYVIITADHGEEFYGKKPGFHAGVLTQDLLHVPLIIWGRDLESKPKPRTIEKKVSLIDLAPTMLDLVGIEKPESFKGSSLLRGGTKRLVAQGIFKEKRVEVSL